AVQAVQGDDEVTQSLAYEDDSTAAYPRPVVWLPPLQAITADDEVEQPSAPIQDEDYWQNAVAPLLWPTYLPQAWPQEQDEQAFGLVPPPPPTPPAGGITGGGGDSSTRIWPFGEKTVTHYRDGKPVSVTRYKDGKIVPDVPTTPVPEAPPPPPAVRRP